MSLGGLGAAALAVVAGVLGLTMFLTLFADPEPSAAAPGGIGTGLSDQVPAEYVPWVQQAGQLCPEFPPALIAAQLDVESHFDADAVSPAGAQGPAQFMPGTWASWGRDDDGNGTASPFDIGDAVMAQGRYDCHLAELVRPLGGDTCALALAAYNAGPGAVLQYGGIPPYPETQAYVPKILALALTYAGAPAAPATGAAAAVIAAAASQLGVPYAYGGGGPTGPSNGMTGNAPGFDCSSLMQYAFAQGAGLSLPRVADQQGRTGTAISRDQLAPGDVVAFAYPGSGRYHHIGLYIGNGQMIHAPQTGDVVKVTTITGSSYWESLDWSIRRYL